MSEDTNTPPVEETTVEGEVVEAEAEAEAEAEEETEE